MLDTTTTMDGRMKHYDRDGRELEEGRMRGANRLHSQREGDQSSGRWRSLAHLRNSLLHNRRPKTTLAGALVFSVAVLSAAGTQVIHAVAGDNSSNASTPPAAAVTATNEPAPTSPAAGSDSASSNDQGTKNVNVSTNVSTTTDSNGQPSTQVTVNGKPVAVPANGSTQQTTQNGNQQTSISVSQATSGQSDTHTSTHTSVNVSSDDSSTINQEDSMSDN